MVRSAEERFAMERMATRGFGVMSQSCALVRNVKKLLFCNSCRNKNSGPLVEKKSAKMRIQNFREKKFCEVHFSLYKRHILKT